MNALLRFYIGLSFAQLAMPTIRTTKTLREIKIYEKIRIQERTNTPQPLKTHTCDISMNATCSHIFHIYGKAMTHPHVDSRRGSNDRKEKQQRSAKYLIRAHPIYTRTPIQHYTPNQANKHPRVRVPTRDDTLYSFNIMLNMCVCVGG